jgi:hypothetical protein
MLESSSITGHIKKFFRYLYFHVFSMPGEESINNVKKKPSFSFLIGDFIKTQLD